MFCSQWDAVTSFSVGFSFSLTVACNIENPNVVITLINNDLETMPLE